MGTSTDAFRDLTIYRDTAHGTYQCAWVADRRDRDHDWCPEVIEPGDEYIAVATDYTVTRYCLGCGYHLYGLPTLAPARNHAAA
jgi:hypothetical protein